MSVTYKGEIFEPTVVQGSIASSILKGTVAAEKNILGYLTIPDVLFDMYTGPYDVIPSTVQQTLYTQNKVMSNNVTVQKIPYYETPNPQGGNTIFIGNEVIINA